jgi:hypothetical protein
VFRNQLCSTIFIALATLDAAAQTRTGLQPVGFAAFSPEDVNKTVDIFKACPANQTCEIAALAYSFGGFENFRTFIEKALPAMTSKQ